MRAKTSPSLGCLQQSGATYCPKGTCWFPVQICQPRVTQSQASGLTWATALESRGDRTILTLLCPSKGGSSLLSLTTWTASRKDKTSAHKDNYREAAPPALSTLLPLSTEGFRNETINRERKACAHRAPVWKLVKQTNPVIPEARTVCNWFKTSPFSSDSTRANRPTCQINESYHRCKKPTHQPQHRTRRATRNRLKKQSKGTKQTIQETFWLLWVCLTLITEGKIPHKPRVASLVLVQVCFYFHIQLFEGDILSQSERRRI